MPVYADDNLISLADESAVTSPISPTSIASLATKIVAKHRIPVKRDSFSDLTVMMKAKKPYTPISPATPRAPLSIATNGMQFASRVSSGSSILSPLARPYHSDGSVATYLQNQAQSPPTAVTSPITDYSEQKMQRLESMLKELDDIPVDDDEDDNTTVQVTQTRDAIVEPRLPGFEPFSTVPVRTGPITPPTPANSTEPETLPTEPVVHVTMHAWEAMGRDLQVLEEKRALELKIARLEKLKASPPRLGSDKEEELHTEIGHLKFQNEQNKTQKATMARTLSQIDVEIQQLQLDLDACKEALERAESAATSYAEVTVERDYLQTRLRDDRISASDLLSDLKEVKNREIQTLTQQLNDVQEVVRQLEEAKRNSKHNDLAEVRLEALNKCEKQLKTVNAKYAAEHAKVNELEDHIELLQSKLREMSDLQTRLGQKSADCDRWRTKYKNQEKVVETCKRQMERAADENTCLRGAAHLVKPAASSKLSPVVMSCSSSLPFSLARTQGKDRLNINR
ncbi:hypothetical protein E8E11_007527 [Didymella keratinophila]|nr:hypothetical protein E8E11_007527 [Didymella keratinophila]